MKQSNARVSSRSEPIPSTGCSNRESPVTNLPTRSWYDQVTVTRRTQRQPWVNVRGGRQQAGNVIGSDERAQRTSCAQAGTAWTVFSKWSATNATPTKQEWHGRQALGLEQYVLLQARLCRGASVVSKDRQRQQRSSGIIIKFNNLQLTERLAAELMSNGNAYSMAGWDELPSDARQKRDVLTAATKKHAACNSPTLADNNRIQLQT